MDTLSIVTLVFIFVQVFGYTLTCEFETIKYNLKNKRAILTGMVMQFLIMPFTGFLTVSIFKNYLFKEQETCILLITTCPGGNQSNFWNSIFNAELGLSLTMTSINSLLSLMMIPINIIIYTLAIYGSKDSAVDALDWRALVTTILITIVAFVLGCFLCLKVSQKENGPKIQRIFYRIGSIAALGLLVIAFIGNISGGGVAFYDQPWYVIVAAIAPVLIGTFCALMVSRFIAKLPKPECVTIMIETAMQNLAIALTVSIQTYADDEVALANALSLVIFYGIAQGLTSGIGCLILWKMGWTKAPKDEKFLVMIFKSYEIKENVHDSNNGVQSQTQELGNIMGGNQVEAQGLGNTGSSDADSSTPPIINP